jgi:hypothetical protein
MTDPTTQSREAFEAWIKTLKGYPFAGAFSNLMWLAWQSAIQAGREALLTELRAGGVELPEPFSEYMLNVCLLTDALDYGDRRAAADVADGWVLVPKEPTQAMCTAAFKYYLDWTMHSNGDAYNRNGYKALYKGMLACAPEAPTP